MERAIDNMAEKQPEPLVEKEGRTSPVIWRHFGFKSSDVEQKEIVCKVCHAVVSVPQGNTTNLFNHLKFSHKVVYDKVLMEQKTQKSARASTSATATQSSIEDTLYNTAPYPTGSRRQREITETVTFMLAKDMCAISTVSKPGFKTPVKTMDKRHVLLSANTSAELHCLLCMINVALKLKKISPLPSFLPPQRQSMNNRVY